MLSIFYDFSTFSFRSPLIPATSLSSASIKSEGDLAAGKKLVEDYAVKVDPELHAEVLKRYAALNLAPYKGFVNPVMKLVKNEKGEVTDVTLDYTEGYTEQMVRYGKEYSFLPTYND